MTATVAALHRTLEQELIAILRGASLECPICGEFLLHRAGGEIGCPECGAELGRLAPDVSRRVGLQRAEVSG